MIYLANAFSVGMLPTGFEPVHVTVERIGAYTAGEILRENPFVSVFGHRWTAWPLSRYLHINVEPSRDSIRLTPEDVLIVAKPVMDREYRMAPGAPRWRFYRVKIRENS